MAANPYTGTTYAEAAAYLAKGKKGEKVGRKVSTSGRLWRHNEGEIILTLYSTDIIRYCDDGTTVLATGGWNTHTTRRYLNAYSPATVWTEANVAFVRDETAATYSPAKVQKCRSCSGVGLYRDRRYSDKGNAPVSHYPLISMHHPAGECYRCKGAGRVDYGSKPSYPDFGEYGDRAIRVDGAGRFVEYAENLPAAYPFTVAPSTYPFTTAFSTPTPNTSSSFTIMDALTTALPAIDDLVVNPVTKIREPLRDIVISLNDTHRWSREAIADWLDTLHLDLSFPVPADL